MQGVLLRQTCFETQGCFNKYFFLSVSLFVELCVGCDGLVNVLFTLEGVAMPHIYLMFELCNACSYVSFPFERFNV